MTIFKAGKTRDHTVAKGDSMTESNAADNESGNKSAEDKSGQGNTEIEKILREKFGEQGFGNIMNTIVEEMFKTVDTTKTEK